MPRIDNETVRKILDTADIVDVVSDYVKLKRSGSNYMGLCPFHNERTPSFSVSKTKGICKCFSCGKGGSPVNFIMEIEQMTFSEALRHLAKKYHIEIPEREMSDEERQAENLRESMLVVNDFAMKLFEENLTQTEEGRDIGLAYFRQRGVSDAMISRFHLGYALPKNELLAQAKKKGYSEKPLLETGLCLKSDDGKVYDRFRDRVIFPIFSLSGRVLAFGGRTLRSDKKLAKYVNSPESSIYSKRSELYGLYQARKAIHEKGKCYLVEGYLDVISMHQSGVENVVASSGTSLTEKQINLIHRFTDNVTVIYDSDPAGIKASLRGIDMLLAQGLNIKVVLLPDGDDPDSFAQSHSSDEVERYIANHEDDFIAFKANILLADSGNDPIARARVINDIVASVAVIPDDVVRTVYISDLARQLKIDEDVLRRQVRKRRADIFGKDRENRQREEENQQIDTLEQQQNQTPPTISRPTSEAEILRPFELEILKYAVRYGMVTAAEVFDENNSSLPLSLVSYISKSLLDDGIDFSNEDIKTTFRAALQLDDPNVWNPLFQRHCAQIEIQLEKIRREGVDEIARTALTSSAIEAAEKVLAEKIERQRLEMQLDFAARYVGEQLASNPDDNVRRLTTDLLAERHRLSKIHSRAVTLAPERDRCVTLADRALSEYKDRILALQIKDLQRQISQLPPDDAENLSKLLARLSELIETRRSFSQYLGDRIINPPR